jgi:hypothetical protein
MEPPEEQLTHLRRLAEELARRDFTAEVVSSGTQAHLKVANAATPKLNERILCRTTENGSWDFCWPWQQPIGLADDLETVVAKITTVLRSVGET